MVVGTMAFIFVFLVITPLHRLIMNEMSSIVNPNYQNINF